MTTAEANLCPECGFPMDSREHLEGRGNVHDPDRTAASMRRDERLAAEARAEREAEYQRQLLEFATTDPNTPVDEPPDLSFRARTEAQAPEPAAGVTITDGDTGVSQSPDDPGVPSEEYKSLKAKVDEETIRSFNEVTTPTQRGEDAPEGPKRPAAPRRPPARPKR